ncbi:MAG: M18 family aminopeptidase [Bacilli bacterium]|nr:M18 family aminopeptidase [Bacilli bacterium]
MKNVLDYISCSHSPFHAVLQVKEALLEEGFIELDESKRFELVPGGKYFLTRNGSSILAFVYPNEDTYGYHIAATHNDSPTFVLKPKPVIVSGDVTKLNVEPYGGAILYSWFDRPLSFAGRVYAKVGEEIICHYVDLDEDALVIPSLAIHQNREVNSSFAPNPAIDMVPLWLDETYEGDFDAYLAKKFGIGGTVLSHDLNLYVREEPRMVGGNQDLVLSPRLDDLACAFSSLLGFLEASKKPSKHIPVFVSFDNEEVGSLTQQGADSDFLVRTLQRIESALGHDADGQGMAFANSILISADNAHANHPNHPEKADPTTHVRLNGGIVIKHDAAQHYATNAETSAYVKSLCESLGDPYQEFNNKSDARSGSTLGNISNAQISLKCADVGIAQLAMHSAVELCGYHDIFKMEALLQAHFEG